MSREASHPAADDAALNPQREHMAHESMVRTLAAQADAIWPQEAPLFARYGLPDGARILDAGCGTGEITGRLARLFPTAHVTGVDILGGPLAIARERHEALGARVRFELRSIFELGLPGASFDLVVCRHVLQSVPHADRVLAELARVTRRGGHLHLIAEDYAMLHFPVTEPDPSDFFPAAPRAFGRATNTDLLVGRHAYGLLRDLGLEDIRVDYAIVDTLRVPRETFAAIMEAWRDGYADALPRHTSFSAEQGRALFDAAIASIRDPRRYAVWMVPIIAARVP
jgi:ubiquinone/menaquinone biosynthesis C-methylase UbiE